MKHQDLQWFHSIRLLNGEKTAGRVDLEGVAGQHYMLPDDLTGKSVVDFGTFDGYWAIECHKRGARVLAVDQQVIPSAVMALGERGIAYVGGPEFNMEKPFSVETLQRVGQHDIVLFYGILYHLSNPVTGLVNAAQCCRAGGLVYVESAVNQGPVKNLPTELPLLWLIDGPYVENAAKDTSNMVMPNPTGVLQLCRMAGLKPTEKTASHFSGLRFSVVCEK